MDRLGDRMKRYEAVTDLILTPRMPTILRLDGKSFHQWTRHVRAQRPFDTELHQLMTQTLQTLCRETQGTVFGYTQSDEMSLVLQDYFTHTTEAAFGKRLQKLVSLSAALATAQFNALAPRVFASAPWALFDARAFVLPQEEVANYILWRQQDATCNSIRMVGYTVFADRALLGVSNALLQERLWRDHGINWNAFPVWAKRGSACLYARESGWAIDDVMPVVSQDRAYVERHLAPPERL